MTTTRWYLKRGPWLALGATYPIALVVEEIAEPRRGRLLPVHGRQEARQRLGLLRQDLLDELGGAPEPRRAYSPAPIDG